MKPEQNRSALLMSVTIASTIALSGLFSHRAFAADPFKRNSTFSNTSAFGDDSDSESTPAATGADGVSFMPVPLDLGVNCNSVILKGTRRYQGTAFVLPRVVLAQTKQRETLFEIIKMQGDHYLLRFAIYFPRTDQELSMFMQGQAVRLQGCDFGAVMTALNKNEKDDAKKVQTLARIPISAVDVRIDGIDQPYKLGAVSGSILHYQGLDHVVEYEMTRAQLDTILARIEGNIGLGIHMAIKFNARSGDGALYANVNLGELATAIQAGASGHKLIAAGELQAMIAQDLMKMNLDIESESGNSSTFKAIAEQLMELIMDALGTGSSGGNWGDDNSPFGRSTWNNGRWGNSDNSSPFRLGGGGGLINNDSGTSPFPPQNGGDMGTVIGDDKAMINVQAAIQVLRNKKAFRVTYQNAGPSEQQVYSTSVLFRGEIADPDIRVLNVLGGKENARILPNRLLPGKTMTIAAAGQIPEHVSYKLEKRYLSAKEVTDMKLAQVFPLLRDDRNVLQDRPSAFGALGTLRAKGWFTTDRYVWGVAEAKETVTRAPLQEIPLNADAVSALPIAMTFSKVGLRKFSFADLLKDNAYWKGVWDDMGAKITFTPKQNLGQMTIINLINQKTINIKKKIVFQERRSRDQRVLALTQAQPEVETVPSDTMTYQFQITNDSDAGDVVGVINPISNNDTRSAIIVPQSNNPFQ